MRLSDIMGHLDLAVYPIVAMVIFLGVFAGVCIRIFRRGRNAEFKIAATLPLEDTTRSTGGRP